MIGNQLSPVKLSDPECLHFCLVSNGYLPPCRKKILPLFFSVVLWLSVALTPRYFPLVENLYLCTTELAFLERNRFSPYKMLNKPSGAALPQ